MTNLGPAVSLFHLLSLAISSPIFSLSVPCPCPPLAAFGRRCLTLSVHHWNLLDQNTHPAFLLILLLLFSSSSSPSSSPHRGALCPLRPSLPSTINGTSHFGTWNDLKIIIKNQLCGCYVRHKVITCKTAVWQFSFWRFGRRRRKPSPQDDVQPV